MKRREQPPFPEVLTKENFWNDLYDAYPEAMRVFCEWIDEYKKRVNWDTLFADNIRVGDSSLLRSTIPKGTRAPKFHEIPVAMQLGIWSQFVSEHEQEHSFFDMENYIAGIENYLAKQNPLAEL